jgi:hypothetical protein
MKANLLIVIIIAVLISACTPNVPTQDIKVTTDVPTKTPLIEASFTTMPVTPEPRIKDIPTLTKTPTQVPSKTPPGCLSLLTPLDGAELPAAGKVTFSWSPRPDAASYVLNIILPSGISFAFETEQTFRDQYIEAFSSAGSYQWNVTVIGSDRKRTRICSSELATFSKPASAVPPQPDNDDRKKKR